MYTLGMKKVWRMYGEYTGNVIEKRYVQHCNKLLVRFLHGYLKTMFKNRKIIYYSYGRELMPVQLGHQN